MSLWKMEPYFHVTPNLGASILYTIYMFLQKVDIINIYHIEHVFPPAKKKDDILFAIFQ